MTAPSLQQVADAVIQRAQRQGFVVAREIRKALAQTSLPAEQWKEVIALSGDTLRYRRGRYYHKTAVGSPGEQAQKQRRTLREAVQHLIRQYKAGHSTVERRQHGRTDFVQSVKVRFQDGRELVVVSRDLSPTGVRLIGTRSLLGHKVHVEIPSLQGEETVRFLTRIIWTIAIGDGLYENGGTFLEKVEALPLGDESDLAPSGGPYSKAR
jgi:hypothetical protein